MDVAIIGGGLFGLASARALARRGHGVTVYEAGRIPAARAASRDISKALRLGYGAETSTWAPWVLEARDAWRALEHESGRRIYHETGYLALSTRYESGSLEFENVTALQALGRPVEVLAPAEIGRRFQAIATPGLAAGVFDPVGGWLDPMQALPALAESAVAHGARILEESAVGDVAGLGADAVLVCAGAWVSRVLADVGVAVTTTRQHESLFRPAEPQRFDAGHLPVWSCDLARAGFYGFSRHSDGWVKVACHAPEPAADPDLGREGDPVQHARIVAFVRERIPGLADAPAEGRSCYYTMAPDGTFVFDAVPGRDAVFVAGCGSGHGFKFGPLLGEWGARLVLGEAVPAIFRRGARSGPRVV